MRRSARQSRRRDRDDTARGGRRGGRLGPRGRRRPAAARRRRPADEASAGDQAARGTVTIEGEREVLIRAGRAAIPAPRGRRHRDRRQKPGSPRRRGASSGSARPHPAAQLTGASTPSASSRSTRARSRRKGARALPPTARPHCPSPQSAACRRKQRRLEGAGHQVLRASSTIALRVSGARSASARRPSQAAADVQLVRCPLRPVASAPRAGTTACRGLERCGAQPRSGRRAATAPRPGRPVARARGPWRCQELVHGAGCALAAAASHPHPPLEGEISAIDTSASRTPSGGRGSAGAQLSPSSRHSGPYAGPALPSCVTSRAPSLLRLARGSR